MCTGSDACAFVGGSLLYPHITVASASKCFQEKEYEMASKSFYSLTCEMNLHSFQ